MHSHGGGHQTLRGLGGSDGQVESMGSEAEGSRHGEGDGKPRDASQQVTLPGGAGLAGNGSLPVGLINEDRAEVSDDVDDTEDKTSLRPHGQETSMAVASGKLQAGGVLTLDGIAYQVVVHPVAASDVRGARVDLPHEDEKSDEDDDSVREGGVVSSLQPSKGGVDANRNRDQEACSIDVHTRQRLDCRCSSQDQHGRDDEVGENAKEEEDHVRGDTPADQHNLEHRVDGRTLPLDFDGQSREQDDLDRCSSSIPERSRHALLVCDIAGLQESGCPCPL
mmetsp:Transcript_18159/g.59625  ORF Transcript_18159/g.59625 Transcript_18159/m.59625 type:complete len:279 (+) Transcript_18159:1716-2552(+)